MPTWEAVRELALSLPATEERVSRATLQWRVRDRLFVWERPPLVWERPPRKSDLEALGPSAPEGPTLGARVEDEGAKAALITDDPLVFFTTPHFDGYPAVLAQLEWIGTHRPTPRADRQGRVLARSEVALDGYLADS